jgi:AcrR family transcriptional regulator
MSAIDELRTLRAAFEQALSEAEFPLDAKGKTRARILRAATQCFQRDGYKKATVDDIASRAGVAKGTVYTHFADKTELLFFSILEEKRQLIEPFRVLFSDESLAPPVRLTRYFELAFLVISRAPLITRLHRGDHEMVLFLEEMPAERRAMLTRNQSTFSRAFLSGVGAFDALDASEQDQRARTVWLMMMNAAQLMDERLLASQGLSPEQAARQLAQMMVVAVGRPA